MPAFRVRLGYRVADRHFVTALYAPLQLNARGSVNRDVSFFAGTYPAGSPEVYGSSDAQPKFVHVAAWNNVMNLDRFEVA